MPVRWELCGSSQNGAFYAGPGKTILSIKGAPDTGRLVIFWKDADGAPQQAIVDPADSNRILLPLQISSSRDIDKCELLWRISNPNPFPVLVRWSALGGQKGRTIAQPGETDISTRSIYGTNEITISWKDGAGLHTGNASAILPAKKAGKVSKKHPHGNFGPRYEF